MIQGEVDALGYGLETAPAKQHRDATRRRRLKARLLDLVIPVSQAEVAPEVEFSQLEPEGEQARRLYERAVVYCERSQYHHAVSLLRRVVRDFPADANAWYVLGLAFGELGRRAESIECFDHVIDLNPNLAQAWCNRGWQRLRSKDRAGAIRDFRKATDLDPRDAMAWSHLGLALRRSKKIEEAAEAYRRSAFCDSENARTCRVLASCLRRLGRRDGATIWQKKALSLSIRMREPKPSIPAEADYQGHAVGQVLARESLVVDVKAVRRQKQVQSALKAAQNPVSWMVFLILVALMYVLLGK